MTKIQSTTTELIPASGLASVGIRLTDETDVTRYGYPAGVDLFEALWYELANTLRFGQNWRTKRVNEYWVLAD